MAWRRRAIWLGSSESLTSLLPRFGYGLPGSFGLLGKAFVLGLQ